MQLTMAIVDHVHRRIALDVDVDLEEFHLHQFVHRYPSVFEYDHRHFERHELLVNRLLKQQQQVQHYLVEIEEY